MLQSAHITSVWQGPNFLKTFNTSKSGRKNEMTGRKNETNKSGFGNRVQNVLRMLGTVQITYSGILEYFF